MLGLLLRQRFRLFWNRLGRGPRRWRRVAGTVVAGVVGFGFVLLAGLNAGQLVQRVARTEPEAAAALLPVLLVGVAALTFVTAMGSAFHHLFLAGDLELLLAAPVPARSFFWLKILEIWRASIHVLIFQAAALWSFGQALAMPAVYYPLALLVCLLLTVAASAAGAIFTLLLARIRFGDSVLGLSQVLAVLLVLPIGVLGVPALGFGRNRLPPLVGLGSIQDLTASVQSAGPPPAWAPTTWAAHLLLGDDAAGLSLVLLLVTSVVLGVATRLAFDAQFQAGWERVRFSAPRRPGSGTRRIGRGLLGGTPSGPVVGVLQKDWRTLARDPRWRTGAVISLIALGLPAMVLFAGGPFGRGAHGVSFWLGMLPVPYLAYLFGSQHGGSTLAYEGRNIALLRAAPVSMLRILLAKLFGGLGLVMLVTWLATLALALNAGGALLEIGAALAAATWLASGATLAAVAGAALTADFEADNPQRRVGCFGTIVTSALSLFFFVSNTGLLVWWIVRGVVSVPRPLVGWLPVADWGLPLVALLSVAAIAMASRFGLRRLANWEAS